MCVVLADIESCVGMVSHLIGLVGHVLVRVQLLNAARKVSERHVGVASEGNSNTRCGSTFHPVRKLNVLQCTSL